MTMTTTTNQPTLPPLFFHSKESQPVSSSSVELPAELLHQCLVEYADWGDLAKVSCVQKGWSHTMMAAAEKDQESKWELAQALLAGKAGLAPNATQAFRLLSELANVPVDNDNLPTTTEESAQQECFAPAMKAIADCYFHGHGVSAKNPDAGVAWLRAAYEMGHDYDAAHDLALVYEYGRHDVEIDIFAAAEWLTKAATEGHIEAMAELGLCYELGCGVVQSDTDALDWYMKAAEAGHITSKFSVAEAFEEARGVPQSDSEACLWYYKAAIEGDHDSKMALRRLEEIARIVVPGVSAVIDV
ncbi:Inherit from NOG: Sel1 domain protein repeat-containing protein [Seminavis robusta]|uniref:Inherit from NOG: Sel1 domain protein repeat-containing protein n=1 Tax=Seminavis robusta TaxID=568900 RepID=A0A9N8HSA6_9STRA|nr:Inherit from NOG: Sel1 domain protein repeat-containing protein [Seminavis robusta]|eukprot:Sro1363_g266400.1 Inherit from NOG: Sel1 domain protein repeat-containing protein (301) ;mRNA; r:23358-24260